MPPRTALTAEPGAMQLDAGQGRQVPELAGDGTCEMITTQYIIHTHKKQNKHIDGLYNIHILI